MVNVIQVKIQKYTNCRKKSSENAWFDRSKHVSVEFYFSPNSTYTYCVSSKTLLLYKGNPKHVFVRLFKEGRVCLLCI